MIVIELFSFSSLDARPTENSFFSILRTVWQTHRDFNKILVTHFSSWIFPRLVGSLVCPKAIPKPQNVNWKPNARLETIQTTILVRFKVYFCLVENRRKVYTCRMGVTEIILFSSQLVRLCKQYGRWSTLVDRTQVYSGRAVLFVSYRRGSL